jgi:hypothetical protein
MILTASADFKKSAWQEHLIAGKFLSPRDPEKKTVRVRIGFHRVPAEAKRKGLSLGFLAKMPWSTLLPEHRPDHAAAGGCRLRC